MTYFYVDNNVSGNGSFVLIKSPGLNVTQVNGHYGPVVTLETDDISENAASNTDALIDETAVSPAYAHNRYFTEKRVYDYMAKKTSIRDYPWQDAAKILLDSDSFVISCGK